MTHPGPLHTDRERALSFGGIAAQYDRARPSYPPALIDRLMEWSPRRVLDVGCGTGKASRLLTARGCDVLGVEPDPSMAAVARRHGIPVEVGTFEEWDARQRTFDLVTSAQAWHWVQPAVGSAKAAAVLNPGGHLGVFWNRGRHEPDTAAALDAVYLRLAPGIALPSSEVRTAAAASPGRWEALVDSGRFTAVETEVFPWEKEYDRAGWLEVAATHSDHVTLPEAERVAILDAVGDVIDRRGGTIRLHYSTILLTATRAE